MKKTYDPDHYRVVFFSSAPIGVPFLDGLIHDKRFDVVGIVTQCDKPTGRGMDVCENIIKQYGKTIQNTNMPSTVLLLDGFGWDGTSNRFPRLQSALETRGYSVYAPHPKNTNTPVLEEQLDDIIQKYGDIINADTIIIGHSLWCLLANHLITTVWRKINTLISVAPAFRENNIDEIAQKYPAFESAKKHLQDYQKKDFDTQKLEHLVTNHIIYLSDNDPYIPYTKAKKYYEDHFPHASIKTHTDKGHFNQKAGIDKLPEIIEDILPNCSHFIATPTKINPATSEEGKAFSERLTEKNPDFLVVIAYGKIIPQTILDIPKLGAINIHGSLLPKYRGASPIQSTLLHNDKETGITIIKMDAGMDTGNMLDMITCQIPFQRTTKELIQNFERIWPKFLTRTLRKYAKHMLGEVRQQEHHTTYCGKIEKESWLIDPRHDTIETIYNKYRAFYLRPKIYFMLTTSGQTPKRIIIEKLELNETLYNSNDESPLFQTRTIDGQKESLILHPAVINIEIKPEGKKPMWRKEFINGYIK